MVGPNVPIEPPISWEGDLDSLVWEDVTFLMSLFLCCTNANFDLNSAISWWASFLCLLLLLLLFFHQHNRQVCECVINFKLCLSFSLVPRLDGNLSRVWERDHSSFFLMPCFLDCRYTIFKDHITLGDCILLFSNLASHSLSLYVLFSHCSGSSQTILALGVWNNILGMSGLNVSHIATREGYMYVWRVFLWTSPL